MYIVKVFKFFKRNFIFAASIVLVLFIASPLIDDVLEKTIFRKEVKKIEKFYSNPKNLINALKDNNRKQLNNFLDEWLIDPKFVDQEYSKSLILWALSYQNYDFCISLVKKGADVNISMPETGITPLHIASADNQLYLVRALVENGALINAKEHKQGLTPLDIAKRKKNYEVVSYLKGRGATSSNKN